MQVQKKWLAAVVLLTFMLTALLPQAVLAEPETWDAVLADYPDHAVNDFSMGLGTTCRLTWAAVVSQLGADKPVTVRIFGAEGALLQVDASQIPLATGQHVSVTLVEDTRGVNLFQVIIRGDVLGTGRLSIAQLARMAAALNDTRPLEGLYAQC